MIAGEHCQEPEADHRGRLQSARRKVLVTRTDDFIKGGDRILNLGADSADQQIPEWRHGTQNDNRTVFDPSIRLWQGGEENVGHSLVSP